MALVAVIGGSGFYSLPGMKNIVNESIDSIYGDCVAVAKGQFGDKDTVFIARHGANHSIPPHKINYRANIDVLSQLGVTHIIAINAVGSMHSSMSPGCVVIPQQVIDYTWGREHTFYNEFSDDMAHVDFSAPLQSELRLPLLKNLSRYLTTINNGTYACVQGPRLETAAEIKKYKRDGCDLVGMTMMPEASLAREKNIAYISVCVVCNWAAGVQNNVSAKNVDDEISMAPLIIEDIKAVLEESLTKVCKALADTLTFF